MLSINNQGSHTDMIIPLSYQDIKTNIYKETRPIFYAHSISISKNTTLSLFIYDEYRQNHNK